MQDDGRDTSQLKLKQWSTSGSPEVFWNPFACTETSSSKLWRTGDKSWVSYRDQQTSIDASSREEIPLMEQNSFGPPKLMITVCFGGEGLISVNALDLIEAFSQGHFISFVPPHLEEHAQNLPRPKQSFELAMHITNTH
jgi:hypothetical protein